MRVFLVFMLGLAFFVAPAPAVAQQFVLHWALNHEPVSYFEKVAGKFKSHVEKGSHGRIQVVIDRERVPDTKILAGLKDNRIQLSHAYTYELEVLNPEFQLFQLPFLFESDDHLALFSRSEEGRRLFASLQPKGIHAAGYTYSGGQIGVFGPKISSLSELKGSAYNVENGDAEYIGALRALGIDAKKLNGDLPTYEGLQNREVASGESIPWLMKKFMNRSPVHFNRTRHRIVTRVLLLSEAFLQELPPDLRRLVSEETRIMAEQERQIAIDDIRDTTKKFARVTHRFNDWTSEQRNNDRKYFEGFYRSFAKNHARLLEAVEASNPARQPRTAASK